jgi:hypothetical protein
MRQYMMPFLVGLPVGWLAVAGISGTADAQDCYEDSQTSGDCCGVPVYPTVYLASGSACSQPDFTYLGCGCFDDMCCPEDNYWERCSCFGCLMSCC